MSGRRINLGKLRNPKSYIPSAYRNNDDENRVESIISNSEKMASTFEKPTIIPQSREDYDHQIRWRKEGENLLKMANVSSYEINTVLDVLLKAGNYELYHQVFEFSKQLLTGIDKQDYTLISTSLNIWSDFMSNPEIINLLHNNL